MKLFNFYCLTLLFFISFCAHAQNPNAGAVNCVNFDGTSNFLSVGDVFDELALPITIEAWVKMDDSLDDWGPVFASQEGTKLIYYGFWLFVKRDGISVGYGDGKGGHHPAFRRSKTWTFNGSLADRWVHIAGVMRSKLDMDIFVNGINVGGSYTGNSDSPMKNKLGDLATIGRDNQNTKVYYYQGELDELRIWEVSRSESEIRDTMCKRLLDSPQGLLGYWRFDEESGVFLDHSPGNHPVENSINTEQVSGAPIGDFSAYIYEDNWNDKALEVGIKNDVLRIDEISTNSNVSGFHIYWILGDPNSLDGLPASGCRDDYYYGIFQARFMENTSSEYTLSSLGSVTEVVDRLNNTVMSWSSNYPSESDTSLQISLDEPHTEFVNGASEQIELAVDDAYLCQGKVAEIDLDDDYSYTLNGQPVDAHFTLNEVGVYDLIAMGDCVSKTFSFEIRQIADPYVSLNEDVEVCFDQQYLITPLDFFGELSWNTGETGESILVSEPGIYRVTSKNVCGQHSAEIEITSQNLDSLVMPNVITPNADGFNDEFVVDERLESPHIFILNRWGKTVFESSNYDNSWAAENVKSGVYYYLVQDRCQGKHVKGNITVIK